MEKRKNQKNRSLSAPLRNNNKSKIESTQTPLSAHLPQRTGRERERDRERQRQTERVVDFHAQRIQITEVFAAKIDYLQRTLYGNTRSLPQPQWKTVLLGQTPPPPPPNPPPPLPLSGNMSISV